MDKVTNIKIAGLGGMGILKSAEILAEVLFKAGYDVKKTEVHGMAQRGGSVASDIRFGKTVLSPMIPDGETDYLVLFTPEDADLFKHTLRTGGEILEPGNMIAALPNKKALNIAMLGILSTRLAIDESAWTGAICSALPEKTHEDNLKAFEMGRHSARKTS